MRAVELKFHKGGIVIDKLSKLSIFQATIIE